ncbi:Ceramide synthase 4 [Hondaea fermentalgiana]|uniref:Ceramide synthase 4 n=1 Tax=Hondaea fermentalgiana TaxID=2315210 RepID=A0A2R5H0I7_9STRA|nr:Ceramide synthase 4 [Hondaea fermentalgiana]|eukprot:GBG34573.1 Ceramide synthase 4 [Hondaea fermentalgiana]
MNEVKSLSKAIDKPVEDVNGWFRSRQRVDRESVKVRVAADCLWRLGMYALCFFTNLYILRGQPWSRNLSLCWEDIPLQRNEESVRWFYVALEIPLYLVLLVSQLTEGRRASDMWEMTVHHTTVLVLLSIVYLGNFVRIGMVGLLLHDVTDIFLESSKLASNFRWKGMADLLFVGFAGSWAYARIYRVSTALLPTLFTDGRAAMSESLYKVVIGLMAVLVCLNLYWFFKISSLLYRILWAGSPKERAQRDFTDLSTDDEVDSDSSYFSDVDKQ